ncbi:hypothetical protein E0493_21200 [Roseomonas sp. M0104]|uniref:Uncharacterized protein n=1 Tax=Teichococcus coralli TaxID=2545983 RepID=A0A845BL46_9PROT|nr:hypothetical protein [Pseudoroseomonas coralli]MXP65872.1 hypothetical protein [Pseudoroseomonas coralli]
MSATTAPAIYALDLGPQPVSSLSLLRDEALDEQLSGAVVAGSIVAFAPGVSEQHRQDVMQSLLLAQLAANAKAERQKDPVAWFQAYRGVLEQAAWVIEASSAATRYLPQVSTFSVSTVVDDVLRPKLLAEELAFIATILNAFRSDTNGTAQLVFECPSHSGGIGNFQVALAAEEGGTLSLRLAQISFNTPQHVIRLMLEQFAKAAQFRTAFLALNLNEDVYARLRSSIASKLEGRMPGAVALIQLPA